MPSVVIPPFSWHDANQWSFNAVPISLLVAAAILYTVGARRRPDWPRARVGYFAGGLAVTFVATESFLGVFDREYFSVHMIQHLLLIMVAAALFALAAPLDLLYENGGDRLRRLLDGRVVTFLTQPLFAFVLYFVAIPVTHLTGFVNLTLRSEEIHNVEHVVFLVVGYLFFRAVFGRERGAKLHHGLRLVYVMAAVPVDTFTGLALVSSTSVPFSAYRSVAPSDATHAWLLGNVHLGGAIMWIGGDALMLLACIPVTVAWVKWETVRTRELDAVLDAQGI